MPGWVGALIFLAVVAAVYFYVNREKKPRASSKKTGGSGRDTQEH